MTDADSSNDPRFAVRLRSPLALVADGFALLGQSVEPLGAVLVPLAFATQFIGVALAWFGTAGAVGVHDGVFEFYVGTSTATFTLTRDLTIAVTLASDVLVVAVSLCALARTVSGQSDEETGLFSLAMRRLGPLLWIMVIDLVLVCAGTLALILPGLYLAFAFAVALPVLAIEDIRGSAALMRSLRLVQGRWWSTFFANACVSVIVIGSVVLIRRLLAVPQTVPAYVFTRAAAEFALQVIVLPIGAAVMMAVYADLRAREEHAHVAASGSTLAVPPPVPMGWPDLLAVRRLTPRRWPILRVVHRPTWLRRPIMLAVALAAIGVGAALFVEALSQGGPDFAAADAGVARFRPPRGFVAITVLDGREPCGEDALCFRVSRPTTAIEPRLRGMLASVGADSVTGSCFVERSEGGPDVDFCNLTGRLDGVRVALTLQPVRVCRTALTCTSTHGNSEVIMAATNASFEPDP